MDDQARADREWAFGEDHDQAAELDLLAAELEAAGAEGLDDDDPPVPGEAGGGQWLVRGWEGGWS